MSIRILKKAVTLLIVDIVIIIGIFVLQFRTDSSIIEKIGNLQFTFQKSEDENKVTTIKNKLNISYNGLNFFCDDQHPAVALNNKSETYPIEFIGWEKVDDLSYKLSFSDDINVTFELASTDPVASLAIIADLPNKVQTFAIPYNYSSNMKTKKDDGNRVILDGRKNSWEVSAHSLSSGYFAVSSSDYVATYAVYDETQKFTFDAIAELDIANAAVFNQNLAAFKNNLITAYKNNNSESNITEQIAVSYVAAQADNGNYSTAIDEIPASVKKNKQRTYLSAPYFNTLEEMNVILEKAIKDNERKITEASNANSMEIFTTHNIANFMCIHSNPDVVKKLLQSTAYVESSSLTIAQATGIINVFVDLSASNAELAKCLVPAIENCIERITEACSYEGNVLTISENDTFLSVIQAVETGVALLRYGKLTSDSLLQKAGYVLINSYLTESSSFDLRTLSNLYPIIAFENWYYPHFQKVYADNNNFVWAWTSAKNITRNKDVDGSITYTIDFPENLTHYLILKGIPQFSTIYIYNMAFRTDPRFETYNSSGYVYKQNTQTLLLKSRHKSQLENVRFEYTGVVEKPNTENTVKIETPAVNDTTTVSTESNTSSITTETVESKTATESEEKAVTAETTTPVAIEEKSDVTSETTTEEISITTEETVSTNEEASSEQTEEAPTTSKSKRKKRNKNNN